MQPTDLTLHVLREIGDEIREMRVEQRGTNERIDALTAETRARFEVIETTLRDLAEPMVMLSRGIRVALD